MSLFNSPSRLSGFFVDYFWHRFKYEIIYRSNLEIHECLCVLVEAFVECSGIKNLGKWMVTLTHRRSDESYISKLSLIKYAGTPALHL